MGISVISKGIGGANEYRKPIVVAAIVAMIMGIFVSGGQAYGAVPKEPAKTAVLGSTEIEGLSEEIKQLVKGLEYSDEVAQGFVKMVIGWKDKHGQIALVIWKKKLDRAKEEFKQDEISKDQLAKIEESIIKELGQKIRKQISLHEEFFDLGSIITEKRANCLGCAQLVYIAGNSVGLSVRAIHAVESVIPVRLPEEFAHVACIVSLADGSTMMVDLAFGPIMSKTFKFEKEFRKVGSYWELKDKDNTLGIHRRIQILDKNGLIASIYYDRGTTYAKSGPYTKAIHNFNKAIEFNPNFADAYTNRGKVHVELAKYSDAISDCTKAIELYPKHALAYNNRGVAYSELGQLMKALADFNKAIALKPKFAEPYSNRGVVYDKLGQLTRAVSDHNKAVELNPKAAKAYYNRGVAYYKLNKLTEAMSDYTKAIELNPKYATAYSNRGVAYINSGEPNKAIADYTKAIELNPKFAGAYCNRGTAYSKSGQYIQAILDFNKAIELNPNDFEAYRNRGLVYGILVLCRT